MWQRIVNWYDWKIYKLAGYSLRRLARSDGGGFVYLLKLRLDNWLEEHPVSDSLKRATEEFHNALRKK